MLERYHVFEIGFLSIQHIKTLMVYRGRSECFLFFSTGKLNHMILHFLANFWGLELGLKIYLKFFAQIEEILAFAIQTFSMRILQHMDQRKEPSIIVTWLQLWATPWIYLNSFC